MLIAGSQGVIKYSHSIYVMNSNVLALQQGPTINVGHFGHGCGIIVQGVASDKYSIIIAGGTNGGLLNQVEILDDGGTSWRHGPNLPFATCCAPMVENQRGIDWLHGGLLKIEWVKSNLHTHRHSDHILLL